MQENLSSKEDPFMLNALTLAYVGDGIFELLARTFFLKNGSHQLDKIHRRVVTVVNADSQSEMSDIIFDKLNEKELAIYRRGKNSSTANPGKHPNIENYKKATGLEAVFGYLYLSGQYERMKEIFLICLESIQ